MNSYDLTEDDRGLTFGRMVNIDLVIVRNLAYVLMMEQRNDRVIAIDHYESSELYRLTQQLLES